jgi:predicted HTH transcriptional regulator
VELIFDSVNVGVFCYEILIPENLKDADITAFTIATILPGSSVRLPLKKIEAMDVFLSEREQLCFDIIKENPGITSNEVAKLLPQYTKRQIQSVITSTLRQTKGLIKPDDEDAIPYRWYVR